MALVSLAAFARLAGVSRAAITQRRKVGRLHMNAKGLIDTDSPEARYYIDSRPHQRRTAVRRHERAGEDLGRRIENWWKGGGLPDGWAVLALSDAPDPEDPRMVCPLYFYSPDPRDKNPVAASDYAAAYTMDLEADPSVAIEANGTRHPLTLRTFGNVPWVDDAEGESTAALPGQAKKKKPTRSATAVRRKGD